MGGYCAGGGGVSITDGPWWDDTSAGERVWEFITADVNLLEGQPWGTLMRNKLTGATRFRTYPDTIPARKIPLRRKYREQR